MEHRNIPNDGLHEPKDIVFAAAGQVYVADGAGSGTWRTPPTAGIDTALQGQVYMANGSGGASWEYLPGGWGQYDDTGESISVGVAPVELSVDGEGPRTNTDNLPDGTDLWIDTSFNPLRVGDVYAIEVVLEVATVTGAGTININLAGEEFSAPASVGSVRVSSNIHVFNDEDVEILVSTDAGTAQITNRRVKIVRLYGAV